MKIAFTHNLKRSGLEDEAEFDTPATVAAISAALASGGHEVEEVDVCRSIPWVIERLEAFRPDLVFNTAEGRRGRAREALFPALFDELGYLYTGADARVLAVTLDKWLSKLLVAHQGVDTPKACLLTASDLPGAFGAVPPFPVIVKPNYEGSSKGISDDSVAFDERSLRAIVEQLVHLYPAGVLVEEFIAGIDVTVPLVDGLGDDGVLTPSEYVVDAAARSRHNIYDYRLKNVAPDSISVRCPPALAASTIARVCAAARVVATTLGARDFGRIDFRLGEGGRLSFLEINALPSLEPGTALTTAAAREGLSYAQVILHIAQSVVERRRRGAPALERRSEPVLTPLGALEG